MLTLTRSHLAQMTGQQLIALLAQGAGRARRQGGADLEVDGQPWRIYTSTHRRRSGTLLHLWRTTERRVVLDDGPDEPQTIHMLCEVGQRIAEMVRVE